MPLRSDAKTLWGPVTLTDHHAWDADGQQISMALDLTVAGYIQPHDPKDTNSDDECYVVADLGAGHTTISPGTLQADDDENRGYYTHAVDVRMSLADPYRLDQVTPDTTAASGSGSTTSGTSETIGFFGDQLTGSFTSSSSHGGSRTYQDYEVRNLSTWKTDAGAGSDELKHHLELRLCDAGPYVTPFSLITTGEHYLAGLPPRATSNLPLTSAATFRTTMPADQRPDTAELKLTIKHWLAKVIWQSMFSGAPSLNQQSGNHELQLVGGGLVEETVAEYDMTKGPGMYTLNLGNYWAEPWSNEFTWRFSVLFRDGKVSQL